MMRFKWNLDTRCCRVAVCVFFCVSFYFILFENSFNVDATFFRLFMDITVLRAAIKWLMHLTMYFQRNTFVFFLLLPTVIIAHHTRTDEHTKRNDMEYSGMIRLPLFSINNPI